MPPQSIEEIGGKSVPAEMNGLQPEPFEMNGGSTPAELENRNKGALERTPDILGQR